MWSFFHAKVQRLRFTQKNLFVHHAKDIFLNQAPKRQKKQHKIVHMTSLLYSNCFEGIQQLKSLFTENLPFFTFKFKIAPQHHAIGSRIYRSQMQFKYGVRRIKRRARFSVNDQNFINWLQKTLINNLAHKSYSVKCTYIMHLWAWDYFLPLQSRQL